MNVMNKVYTINAFSCCSLIGCKLNDRQLHIFYSIGTFIIFLLKKMSGRENFMANRSLSEFEVD